MRFEILINQQHRQLNCYYSHHHHQPSTYGAEKSTRFSHNRTVPEPCRTATTAGGFRAGSRTNLLRGKKQIGGFVREREGPLLCARSFGLWRPNGKMYRLLPRKALLTTSSVTKHFPPFSHSFPEHALKGAPSEKGVVFGRWNLFSIVEPSNGAAGRGLAFSSKFSGHMQSVDGKTRVYTPKRVPKHTQQQGELLPQRATFFFPFDGGNDGEMAWRHAYRLQFHPTFQHRQWWFLMALVSTCLIAPSVPPAGRVI